LANKHQGITRRLRKDGTVAWLARPAVGGKRYKGKTFSDLKDAKRWKARREVEIEDELDLLSDETCDHFATRWPRDFPLVKSGPTRGRRKQGNTLQTYRNDLKPFIAAFRGVPLGGIARTTARQFALKHPRSAATARNMYADAIEDELVRVNPFENLRLEQSRGRRDNRVISLEQLHLLADTALQVWPDGYGQVVRAMILFSAYVGPREFEMYAMDRSDVDFQNEEVRVRVAKFDKPRTVMLLDEAADALRSMPGRISTDDQNPLFWSVQGKRLTKGSHHYIWNRVRDRAGMSELEWHELRHWCGHHFYVTLGYSDELSGYQLGHAGGEEIRRRYGHGQQDALERLKQGRRKVVALPHATSVSPKAQEGA
jgi:integrase